MGFDLIHDDTLTILPRMVAQGFRADVIVTDPPYLLESGGCTEGGLHERFGADPESEYGNSGALFDDVPDWAEFMPILYAALADNAHAYVMANNRNVQAMLNAAQAAGFRFHNLLVWDKITATPNRWYMKNCEFTALLFKGKAFHINDCGAKQLIRCPQVDQSAHPTEKPVPLFQHYIENSTRPGALVLDPFMGSGSCGVAALRSGRQFVGIEKAQRWYDVAAGRIVEASENRQAVFF